MTPKPFSAQRQNTLLTALNLFRLEGECWSPSRTIIIPYSTDLHSHFLNPLPLPPTRYCYHRPPHTDLFTYLDPHVPLSIHLIFTVYKLHTFGLYTVCFHPPPCPSHLDPTVHAVNQPLTAGKFVCILQR